MVGGRKETFEAVKPLLLDIGPKVTYVGDNGLALSMKIAINLSLAVQMLAFSEGVLLAEKSGIAREVAVDVLTHSAVASPMIQYRGPFVLQQPEEAWFDVNMMQKDMVLAMDLGRQLEVPLPTTAVSNEILTAARGMGLDEIRFCLHVRCAGHHVGSENAADRRRQEVTTATSKPAAANEIKTEKDRWLHAYRQMVRIRLFEEQVNELYTRALMPGLAHLYSGRRGSRGRHLRSADASTITSPARIAGTDTAWRRARRPIACLPSCWAKKRDTAAARAGRCTLPIRRPEIWERTRLSAAA